MENFRNQEGPYFSFLCIYLLFVSLFVWCVCVHSMYVHEVWVCVVWLHTCMCVGLYISGHMFPGQRRTLLSCSVTLHLIPLTQGLSLNPELDWQTASPINLPASALTAWSYRHIWPHTALYMDSKGLELRVLALNATVEHLLSPDLQLFHAQCIFNDEHMHPYIFCSTSKSLLRFQM